jgi:chemotaxis protein CheX
VLPEILDLRAAVPLAAELKAALGGDLEIDGSQVSKVGGQCLQVLLSAQATWEAAGGTLLFVSLSPEFIEALVLMGAGSITDTVSGPEAAA